jgi:hypothetical protein
MEPFQYSVAPLVHPPWAGREKGSEERRGIGNEWEGRKPVLLEISPLSWIGQQHIILMIEQEQRRHTVSTNVFR